MIEARVTETDPPQALNIDAKADVQYRMSALCGSVDTDVVRHEFYREIIVVPQR
jgi:hypothetical protein